MAEQIGDLDEAQRWHGEALVLARRHGNKAGIALALEGLAGVVAAALDGEQAATLLGAAEQLRATSAGSPTATQRIDVERAERTPETSSATTPM